MYFKITSAEGFLLHSDKYERIHTLEFSVAAVYTTLAAYKQLAFGENIDKRHNLLNAMPT